MANFVTLHFEDWDGQTCELQVQQDTNFGDIRILVAEKLERRISEFELEFGNRKLTSHDTPYSMTFSDGQQIKVEKSASLLGEEALQKGMEMRASSTKVTPVLLDEPVGTVELIELESNLMRPPLFDDLYKIVPLVPLYEATRKRKRIECCEKFAKCCWCFWSWISIILCYPCGLCLQRTIHCIGYMMYYFFLVPVRNIVSMCCHPCIEGAWRCMQPMLVCFIVFGKGVFRPFPEIIGTCIGNCIETCCEPMADCCYTACGPGIRTCCHCAWYRDTTIEYN